MIPATWPRESPGAERLLVVDPRTGARSDRTVGELAAALEPGDLLVLNDAATLPASLSGRTDAGAAIELRLLGAPEGSPDLSQQRPLAEGATGAGFARSASEADAVLFGAGDWHTPTELRPAPPLLVPGALLRFEGLVATVLALSPISPRLLRVGFDLEGATLLGAIYAAGRPVQYSYVARPLSLWHVQSAFATRPWAAELPSAGRPLPWSLLLELRRRGVRLATLTHAAGLSSTGDPALDAALPLPERYELPEETVEALARTKGRVIAVGTTVVRALEGARRNGPLLPGPGVTELKLGPTFEPLVVDGLLTGLHEPGSSHFELLRAFAPDGILRAALDHAATAGYLTHEFGDSLLLLGGRRGSLAA